MRAAALRRPEAALFALVLGAYAYFYQGGGWNPNVRFALVRSLVERLTVRIDGYEQATGDLAIRGGHFYCDKAPGLSFLAVPVYAALHPLADGRRPPGRLLARAAWLATVICVAVPSAVAVVIVFKLALLFGVLPLTAAALALGYAFGTLAFPYSTLFYGHQLAAALLVAGFGLIAASRLAGRVPAPGRLLVAGVSLGYAVAADYPAALAVAAIVIYAAAIVRPLPRLVWLAAGLALPAVVLAVYHTVAFGGPLTLPYTYSNDPTRHGGLFLGLGLPSPRVLFKILLSPERGLFIWSPWLLLGVPGAAWLVRDRRLRAEGFVSAAVVALFFWLNASMSRSPVDWRGGWGVGPRFLIPALPFLALAAAGVLARMQPAAAGTSGRTPTLTRRLAPVAALIAAAWSAAAMLVATSVRPEVPTWYGRPFQGYLIPAFREGRLAENTIPIHAASGADRQAWNVGERLGLSGRATLLPLAVWIVACGLWLAQGLRSTLPPPPAPPRSAAPGRPGRPSP